MSGQSSKSRSQIVDKTSPEYAALIPGFADLLGGQMGNIEGFLSGDLGFEGAGLNLDQYRNPMTIGEQTALRDLGLANRTSANDLLSEDLLGQTLGGDFLSPANNPGLQELLKYTNQAINDAYNTQGSQNKALFARAGHSLPESSPFATAQGDIEKARLDAIGKNVSQMITSNYQAEREHQVQAVEQQRANAGFEFDRQLQFLQASSLPRLIDEIGFDRAFGEFQSRIAMLSQALGLLSDKAQRVLTVETTGSAGGGGILAGGGSISYSGGEGDEG
jgi:hypothetical protein